MDNGAGRIFSSILTAMFFPADNTEPLTQTVDRLVTPDYRQRLNGTIVERHQLVDHLRAARERLAGGRLEVVDELQDGDRLAGQFRFHLTGPVMLESHAFAQLAADGRLSRLDDLNRIADQDTPSSPPIDGADR
jgi:hypothetical protein